MRFVLPQLAAALVAAIGVAVISASLGRNWAFRDVYSRFQEIEKTLNNATIPLTPPVLNSAADLTGTELIALEPQNLIYQSTIELSIDERSKVTTLLANYDSARTPSLDKIAPIEIAGRRFLAFPFDRKESQVGKDRVRRVLVLTDAEEVDAAGQRAALLPLATGISCIILLSTLTITISNHLVKRLITLQRSVQRVAAGDFEQTVADSSTDEVGQLGRAVDTMAAQLKQLWSQVNRQQSERLLHLIAGGMAHQLRNTLTGARMAIELHAQRIENQVVKSDQDEIEVALRELDVAEDYVRRLLLVSAGKTQEAEPEILSNCLRDVYATHAAVARHLRVKLDWPDKEPSTESLGLQTPLLQCWVSDGAAFSAAISNLVLNAMQVADEVQVTFDVASAQASNSLWFSVCVTDNGPGIDPAVEADLLEPFVTSKPEGMGLGLALVKRSAEQLEGEVTWRRIDGHTTFEFRCRAYAENPTCKTQVSSAN